MAISWRFQSARVEDLEKVLMTCRFYTKTITLLAVDFYA